MSFLDTVVQFFSNPIVQQILIGFGSTFSGVFLAFELTLRYDRRKKRIEERQDKIRVLKMLKEELTLNQNVLDYLKNVPPNLVYSFKFATYSMESAVNSGKLMLLELEIQNLLDSLYVFFEVTQIITEKILDMFGSVDMAMQNAAQTLAHLKTIQTENLGTIKRMIPDIMQRIEDQLKDLASN